MPENTENIERRKVRFTVKTDAITWYDQGRLEIQASLSVAERNAYFRDLFDRVIEGGSAAVPMIYTGAAISAIMNALQAELAEKKAESMTNT